MSASGNLKFESELRGRRRHLCVWPSFETLGAARLVPQDEGCGWLQRFSNFSPHPEGPRVARASRRMAARRGMSSMRAASSIRRCVGNVTIKPVLPINVTRAAVELRIFQERGGAYRQRCSTLGPNLVTSRARRCASGTRPCNRQWLVLWTGKGLQIAVSFTHTRRFGLSCINQMQRLFENLQRIFFAARSVRDRHGSRTYGDRKGDIHSQPPVSPHPPRS